MLDQQNKSGVPLTDRSSTSSASTTRPALLNIFARLTLTAATAILSAAVLLLALEVILSLNHIGEQEYLKIDPVLGFMHLENKLVVDRSEGFGIGKINSDGLADVDRAFTKPPETTRIAVLGDSLTEALQVPINERFTRVLEAKLNASSKTGAKFEVINFGVGGFSTGQEFVQYVRDVERFKPDRLMLIYHQGDETENNPDSSKWSLRPTFTMNAKGETQIRFKEFDAWRKSASAAPLTSFEWGRRNSHVWQCLLQIHSSLKNDKLFQKITNFVSVCNTTVHRIVLEIKPELKKHELEESTAEAEAVAKKRSQICEKSQLQVDESQSNENWDSDKQWAFDEKFAASFEYTVQSQSQSADNRLCASFRKTD